MKKLFILSCIVTGSLLVSGCGELASFSNDFDVVRPDVYPSSVKPINDPVTQNNIPFGGIPPSTPDSRYESLTNTWEGGVLSLGWDEGEACGYDESTLTKDEREFAIQKGLTFLSNNAEEKEFTSCNSMILSHYYFVKKDYKKAMYWAFKGAEDGSPDCMCLLSDAYRNGEGVVQDYEEGFKWTYLAAATGSEWSKNWIKKTNEAYIKHPQVYEKISPMLKEAKKRANQWMNEHPEVFISSE